MERLKGKVAVITGGSVGIGAATALRMAEEGAAVAILDCQDSEGEALAKQLEGRGLKAGYWHCDVSKEQEVKQVLDAVADTFGSPTVLVNNAGIAGANKPTHELTEEEWDHVQDVNVKGVFFCTKHAIPHMKKAGVGSIINLSSLASFFPMRDVAVYAASKLFLNSFSESLQKEVAADNIRVQCLCPGYTHTDFHDRDTFTGFEKSAVPEAMWMSVEAVVSESLAMLDGEGKVVFVAGEQNRAMVAG